MEKNYYEILEINKNASKEIMDKAYKTLIKKFKDYLKGLLVILIIFFINSFYQKNYI